MYNEKVHILDHPLLQHKLTILRDENTGVKEFREIVSEIAALECYEATRDLPLADIEVKTPITTGTFKTLAGKKLAVVPILRAGLGMVDGIIKMIPSAKVGHIGLYRDPETHKPVEYYCYCAGPHAGHRRLRLRRNHLYQGLRLQAYQADERPRRPRGHRVHHEGPPRRGDLRGGRG